MTNLKLSNGDLLKLLLAVLAAVYGYGALNTRVSALESQDPIQVGKDIAVLKKDMSEVKSDVKELLKRTH